MRRELLNHILPFSQKEVIFYLSEYQIYYNFFRPHQGIDQRTPAEMYFGIAAEKPPPFSSNAKIKRTKFAGGLLNSYYFDKAA